MCVTILIPPLHIFVDQVERQPSTLRSGRRPGGGKVARVASKEALSEPLTPMLQPEGVRTISAEMHTTPGFGFLVVLAGLHTGSRDHHAIAGSWQKRLFRFILVAW